MECYKVVITRHVRADRDTFVLRQVIADLAWVLDKHEVDLEGYVDAIEITKVDIKEVK